MLLLCMFMMLLDHRMHAPSGFGRHGWLLAGWGWSGWPHVVLVAVKQSHVALCWKRCVQ
jgi:hypothetical protein